MVNGGVKMVGSKWQRGFTRDIYTEESWVNGDEAMNHEGNHGFFQPRTHGDFCR